MGIIDRGLYIELDRRHAPKLARMHTHTCAGLTQRQEVTMLTIILIVLLILLLFGGFGYSRRGRV
jgi:hypothetical protein